MRFAKLFKIGGSQAVRLPREFRFEGDKVRIRREGNKVILEPVVVDVNAWLAELRSIPVDPDFMKERNQPKTPKRRIFSELRFQRVLRRAGMLVCAIDEPAAHRTSRIAIVFTVWPVFTADPR